MARRFLTPEEVASLLRVPPGAVRRLLRRGELPAVRIGSAWRVEEEALERWVRRGGTRHLPAANGRGGPCLCGCEARTRSAQARFLPGHGGKLVHRLMTEQGLSFEAAREAVRRMHRPRLQQRLF